MDERTWSRSIDDVDYVITTRRDLISLSFIQSAFSSKAMYWTNAPSPANTKTMLDNSCTLGIYIRSLSASMDPSPQYKQIGMSRLITDYITFAYLTDVYVEPEFGGKGLGKWIIKCTQEVIDAMPELRRSMLLTGGMEKFYKKEMAMESLGNDGKGLSVMSKTGKGWPSHHD